MIQVRPSYQNFGIMKLRAPTKDKKVRKSYSKQYPQLKIQLENIENRNAKIVRLCIAWFAKIDLINDIPDLKNLKEYLNLNLRTQNTTIEVSFKQGKYKFDLINFEFLTKHETKPYFDHRQFFKPNGKQRKTYKDAKPSLEKSMNTILESFHNYLLKGMENEDWE